MIGILQAITKDKWKLYLTLLIPAILVYGRVIGFDFSPLDEQWMILKAGGFLQDWENVFLSFTKSTADYYYRPLFMISLIVDFHLGEFSPKIYHFMTLIWHLATVFMFYKVLTVFSFQKSKALVIAVIFSIHPMVLHAVAWIPGRNDVMLCFFSLTSIYFLKQFCSSSQAKDLILYTTFMIMALFTKETAVVLPLVSMIVIFLDNKISKPRMILVSAFGIALTSAWFVLRTQMVKELPELDINLLERCSSFLKVLVIYVGKTILPIQQSVYPSLENSSLIFPLLAVAIFIFLTFHYGFSEKKTALFAFLCFLLFLLPPSWYATTKTNSELYEHRIYSALPWFLILAGQIQFKSNSSTLKSLLFILFAFFLIKSFTRVKIYKDKLTFAEAGIKESPDFYLFYQTKAEVEYAKQNTFLALNLFTKAIELRPDKGELYSNRGSTNFKLGNYPEAIADFTEAIAKTGKRKEFVLNRCIAYNKINNLDSAFIDFAYLKECCPEIIPEKLNEALSKYIK